MSVQPRHDHIGNDVITPAMLTRELLRLSKALDEAHDALVDASHRAAESDRDYRKARSTAYLKVVAKTVGEREAQANLFCADEQYAAHLSEALKVAALEKVRSVRAQLSAAQSVASAVKAEIEFSGRWSA